MIPGFVRLSVTGEQRERFLNLCKSRGIMFRRIVQTGEKELLLTMRVKDFFLIGPLRRKTGVHIHILKKRGPVFFLLACRRNKLLPAGVLTVIGVLFFLSGRVWNIHIEGNILNPTPQLVDFLEEKGICCGVSKKKIHCNALAEEMRREFPEITWVSAKLSGTRLSFEIREGDTKLSEETSKDSCSLFSTVDGIVESVVTRQGTPLIKSGEEVKKGQELISGIVNITDDSQEVVRYEYVQADADVYVRYTIDYYDTFPLTIEKKVYREKEKRSFFIRNKNWILDLSPAAKKNEDRLICEYPFVPSENFRLPISAGIITTRKYEIRKEKLTEKAAKKQAIQRLYIYEEKLIEKGVQISENNVKIEIKHQDCVSRGSLTVIEKTGKEGPTERKTQPKERTPEDG